MNIVGKFDYEELCILIPIMRRASKKYIESELAKIETDDEEIEEILQSLKEKINEMDESEIRKLFDELPKEAQ